MNIKDLYSILTLQNILILILVLLVAITIVLMNITRKNGVNEKFIDEDDINTNNSDLHHFSLNNPSIIPHPVVNNSGKDIDIVSSFNTKDFVGNKEEYKGDFIPEMCVLRKTKIPRTFCSSVVGQGPIPQNILNPDTFYEF